ncbi:MAG: FtsX-like permease family protein, partial [Gemmatimonadaceae bacterium]
FSAMRIPVLAGRTFSDPNDPATAHEVVVSAAFAEQYWHGPTGARAIGERVRVSEAAPWSTIVGVVASVRDTSLQAAPARELYFPLAVAAPGVPDSLSPFTPTVMSVVLRTHGDPLALVPEARRAISTLHSTLPIYDVRLMSDVLAQSTIQTTFALGALAAAAVITLILGAIGLYGVVAYAVSLRTRELGLRMALGAEPRMLHAMVIREGLSLALLGVGAGLVVFLVIGRALRGLLFGVGAADPLTLVATVGVLVAIGVVASWLPARDAARVDPLSALRAE